MEGFRLTKNEFIRKARKIHGKKYGYKNVKYINTNTKIIIICPKHGEFKQRPIHHIYNGGHGCQKCKNEKVGNINRKSVKTFILESQKIHGNKYLYKKVKYKNTDSKVIITCRIHGDFKQRPHSHLIGQGCPRCKRKTIGDFRRKPQDGFIKQAKEIHGDKYSYHKVKYLNTHSKVIIVCKQHGEFFQTPHNHVTGKKPQGCPYCRWEKNGLLRRSSTLKFIKKAKKIFGNKYDYRNVVYTTNYEKVKIICPQHGEFEQRPNSHLHGFGCKGCNDSKGEKRIKEYLLKNKIKFISQARFKECKNKLPLSFDFYLPKFKILLEFQGEHHFEPITQWGGKKNFQEIKFRDAIKRNWAFQNGYKLIEISYKVPDIELFLNERVFAKFTSTSRRSSPETS